MNLGPGGNAVNDSVGHMNIWHLAWEPNKRSSKLRVSPSVTLAYEALACDLRMNILKALSDQKRNMVGKFILL